MRIAVLVFGFTCALFAATLAHPFSIYDDPLNVTENTALRPPSAAHLARFWLAPYEGLYAPVAYSCYLAVAALGGLDARWFHAANVLLHAGTAVLVLFWLRRLGISPLAAGFGALAFAVHPLQVESVAWVTETRGLLAGFFGLAALTAYVGPPSSWRGYIVASLCFALALLSKPTAAAVPLMALAIDAVVSRRPWPESARRLAPWFVAVVVLAIVTSAQQHRAELARTSPLWARPLIAFDALGHYAQKFAWPLNLGPDYGRSPYWLLQEPARWWPAAGCALVLVVVALWQAARPCWPVVLLAIAGCAPSLGLTPFVFQGHSTVADRFAYLAMAAVGLAAAQGFAAGKAPLRAALATVVVLWAALAFRQTTFWRSDVAMFTHALEVNPTSELSMNNLGIALSAAGRTAEAIAQLEHATRLDPQFADAYNNLGLARLRSGDPAAAVSDFERALALKPHDLKIRNNLGEALSGCGRWAEAGKQFAALLAVQPGFSNVQLNYARALRNLGQAAQALRHAREACRIEPGYAEAHRELGELLLLAGQLNDAAHELSEALRLAPKSLAARNSLAAAWMAAGDHRAAAREYEAILAATPGSPPRPVLNNLAWLLATSADAALRDGPRALTLAELIPAPLTARELDTLAAAYAATGDFARALSTIETALAQGDDHGDLMEMVKKRQTRYQSGQPWTEP
ncbi:MAG: tetratricopeptide repeat protein [Pirellulales bacterium]|nr:tetratricopeptide repeat protein [Pirellulales bacterium]